MKVKLILVFTLCNVVVFTLCSYFIIFNHEVLANNTSKTKLNNSPWLLQKIQNNTSLQMIVDRVIEEIDTFPDDFRVSMRNAKEVSTKRRIAIVLGRVIDEIETDPISPGALLTLMEEIYMEHISLRDFAYIFLQASLNQSLSENFEQFLIADYLESEERPQKHLLLLGVGSSEESMHLLQQASRDTDDNYCYLFAKAALARRSDNEAMKYITDKFQDILEKLKTEPIKDIRELPDEFIQLEQLLSYIGTAESEIALWESVRIKEHRPSSRDVIRRPLWSSMAVRIKFMLSQYNKDNEMQVPMYNQEKLIKWLDENHQLLYHFLQEIEPLPRNKTPDHFLRKYALGVSI